MLEKTHTGQARYRNWQLKQDQAAKKTITEETAPTEERSGGNHRQEENQEQVRKEENRKRNRGDENDAGDAERLERVSEDIGENWKRKGEDLDDSERVSEMRVVSPAQGTKRSSEHLLDRKDLPDKSIDDDVPIPSMSGSTIEPPK